MKKQNPRFLWGFADLNLISKIKTQEAKKLTTLSFQF